MSSLDFYQTNNTPAREILDTARVDVTETPSYKISYAADQSVAATATTASFDFTGQPAFEGRSWNQGTSTHGIIGSSPAFSFGQSSINNFGSVNLDISPSHNELIKDSYRLRHQVFSEELDWDVVSYEGREVDHYDLMNPYYAILEDQDRKNHCIGTWRALPTTSGYMLRDIFPELCRGEAAPASDDIWEISRFAVDKTIQMEADNNDCCSSPVRQLVDSFYDFGKQQNAKELVAVLSVAGERMLKRMGMTTRRCGDGKAMRIGDVMSTAVWISLGAE